MSTSLLTYGSQTPLLGSSQCHMKRVSWYSHVECEKSPPYIADTPRSGIENTPGM
jgi:hypothetical protein